MPSSLRQLTTLHLHLYVPHTERANALSEVRKHWLERYFSLSKLLSFNKCWKVFQVLNCFRVLRVEFSWYELNKRFPLSLNSIKFLPQTCAVTLTRKQTLAVLASRDYLHHPYAFMFSILLWQGRTGKVWGNFYKMTLPSPNKNVFHLSLVFPFCLLSYSILRFSLLEHFTYQSTFGLHILSKTYATRAAWIYWSSLLRA